MKILFYLLRDDCRLKTVYFNMLRFAKPFNIQHVFFFFFVCVMVEIKISSPICLSVPCLLTKPDFRSNFCRFVLVIMFAL